MPDIALWAPSPRRRQFAEELQVFMRAKALDAGPDLFAALVVGLLPVQQLLACAPAVWYGQSGADVAAVGDRGGLADGGLGAGLAPGPAAGSGRPTTTRRVSASMTIWWLVE